MSFFEELKRRNVVKVAVAYLVSSWVLIQVSETLQELMSLPEWAASFVLFALIIGFPIALIFAWAFELTPDGLKKASDVDMEESITGETGQKINYVIIAALTLTVIGFGVDKFVLTDESESAPLVTDDGKVSIAVLPFADMSQQKDQEYFTDGISEELLNVFARVPDMRVAARTSSFAFKNDNRDIREIANLLDVDHVLEGSIRKAGNTVRITAQLIRASDGYHMWSDTYDRDMSDIFAVQDEISAAILDAMKVHLLGEEPIKVATSDNTQAYEQYLIARNLILKRTRLDIEAAAGYLEGVVTLDPNYAPARAQLALAYVLLERSNSTYGTLTNDEVIEKAWPHLERALELDPNNAETIAIQALYIGNVEENSEDKAIELYKKAIELNSNLAIAYSWLAIDYENMGDNENAFINREKAYALDPVSIISSGNLAGSYISRGEFDKFEDVVSRMEKIYPRSSRPKEIRANAARQRGDFENYVIYTHQALQYEPTDLRVRSNLFNLYSEHGLFDRAAIFLEENNRGSFLREQGKYKEAYESAKAWLAQDPDDINRIGNAAGAAREAGEDADADQLKAQAMALAEGKSYDVCQWGYAFLLKLEDEQDELARIIKPCADFISRIYPDGVTIENASSNALGGFYLLDDFENLFNSMFYLAERGFYYDIRSQKSVYARVKDHPRMQEYMELALPTLEKQRQIILSLETLGKIPNPAAK